jgi:coenzyme F420 hydrogenase subunit beta
MEMNAKGFLRPRLTREMTAQEATLFQRFCPGITLTHPDRSATFTPLWGPIKAVMAGHACDDAIRFKGSSGGVLSALAIHLLESGQVEGVLHIVPSSQNPLENRAQISRSRAEILDGAGSRYAPAAPLTQLGHCLQQEGKFAVIGKPCDIAALRALSRERPDIREKFPFLLAFMCAGTPSLHGTEQVIQEMGLQSSEVSRFRYRGNGWPGMARAETADGRSAEMEYHTAWGRILNRHLQFRCKICPDGTGEFADISCADAWHADEKGYPVFTESAGRSLILIRTEAGSQLVQEAAAQNRIQYENITLAEVEKMQPYQVERKQTLLARLLGFRFAGKATPHYCRMGLLTAARGSKCSRQIRTLAGSWLRGIKT